GPKRSQPVARPVESVHSLRNTPALGACTEMTRNPLHHVIYRMPWPLARATRHEFDVTFVTCDNRKTLAIPFMHPLARYLDPRRSLASAIGWLVFALSIGLVLVASVWVGNIVRTNLLDQRSRQLDGTADRIAAELNLSLALRLQSVRALAALLATELRDENQTTVRRILENLQQASPEFEWIGVANPRGRVLAATHGGAEGASVADRSWFALGLKGPRIGDVRLAPMVTKMPPAATDGAPGSFVDLIASVIDAKGEM